MKDKTFEPSQVVGSGCTDGRMVQVDTTSSPGTLIHRGDESKSGEVWDVVTLEAANTDGSTRTLTILWGGTEDRDKIVKSLIAQNGREVVVLKGRLKRGLEIRAYCGTADVVNIYVEVGVLEAVETV